MDPSQQPPQEQEPRPQITNFEQEQTQLTTSLPPALSKKSQDKKVLVLLTVVAVLLLAVGLLAYLLINKNETISKNNSETTKITDEEKKVEQEPATPEKTPDQYEGWKTFSTDGAKLGFTPAVMEKYDFRYPTTWTDLPIIDCSLGIGEENKGFMCFAQKLYGIGQTVDTFVSSLTSRGDGTKIEKTITIDGHRAVVVNMGGTVNPKAGGSSFAIFIDNIDSAHNTGTVINYAPDNADAAVRASFLQDAEKVIESLKLKS